MNPITMAAAWRQTGAQKVGSLGWTGWIGHDGLALVEPSRVEPWTGHEARVVSGNSHNPVRLDACTKGFLRSLIGRLLRITITTMRLCA